MKHGKTLSNGNQSLVFFTELLDRVKQMFMLILWFCKMTLQRSYDYFPAPTQCNARCPVAQKVKFGSNPLTRRDVLKADAAGDSQWLEEIEGLSEEEVNRLYRPLLHQPQMVRELSEAAMKLRCVELGSSNSEELCDYMLNQQANI